MILKRESGAKLDLEKMHLLSLVELRGEFEMLANGGGMLGPFFFGFAKVRHCRPAVLSDLKKLWKSPGFRIGL
jgi:hypothetical protein